MSKGNPNSNVVFENANLLVEVKEGECFIINKLSGQCARLEGSDDGYFNLFMLAPIQLRRNEDA